MDESGENIQASTSAEDGEASVEEGLESKSEVLSVSPEAIPSESQLAVDIFKGDVYRSIAHIDGQIAEYGHQPDATDMEALQALGKEAETARTELLSTIGDVGETPNAFTTEGAIEVGGEKSAEHLAEKYNCYFIHMLQTGAWRPSNNNKFIDTRKLSFEDQIQLIHAFEPTVSSSTVRPGQEDGTFNGAFGVVYGAGEVVSASGTDNGTIAVGLHDRTVIGGNRDTDEDIETAINRPEIKPNGERRQRSYNEVVLKDGKPAGIFMKLGGFMDRVSRAEINRDYGGEIVPESIMVLDLTNTKDTSYDGTLELLLTANGNSNLFIFDDTQNQMFFVSRIDRETRKVFFQTTPVTPAEMVEKDSPFSEGITEERREELKASLIEKGIVNAV